MHLKPQEAGHQSIWKIGALMWMDRVRTTDDGESNKNMQATSHCERATEGKRIRKDEDDGCARYTKKY